MFHRNAAFTLIGLLVALPAAGQDVRVDGKLISNATSGPPLEVSSTDKVANLNADSLDGVSAEDFATLTDLATAGGAQVNWKNLTNLPATEITQSCATGGGCTGSDSGGFPVTIGSEGLYRLGSNLTTASENQTLIKIEASGVTLNLNGFALLGPVTCTTDPTSCGPAGSGVGIHVNKSNVTLNGVVIRDGTVRGMGAEGIYCEVAGCRILNVSAMNNAGDGMHNDGGHVLDSLGYYNGGSGVVATGIVKNTRSLGNTSHGFDVTKGTVSDCAAELNGSHGVTGTAIVINDSASSFNNTDGFNCTSCQLLGSIAMQNGGDAANLGSNSAWKGNTLISGAGGTINGSPVSLGTNACDGSTC